MKFIMLLTKDFRLIYKESLIILILAALSVMFLFLNENIGILPGFLSYNQYNLVRTHDFILAFRAFIGLFLFIFIPVVFLYSIISERIYKTDFQVFTLPVFRFRLILSKYLLLLTTGILVIVIPEMIISIFKFNNSPEFVLSKFVGDLSSLILILGVTIFITGITATIRKNRLLLGTGMTIGLIQLYDKTITGVGEKFRFYYIDNFSYREINSLSRDIIYSLLYTGPNVFLIITGIIFLVAGLLLYSKFEEV